MKIAGLAFNVIMLFQPLFSSQEAGSWKRLVTPPNSKRKHSKLKTQNSKFTTFKISSTISSGERETSIITALFGSSKVAN